MGTERWSIFVFFSSPLCTFFWEKAEPREFQASLFFVQYTPQTLFPYNQPHGGTVERERTTHCPSPSPAGSALLRPAAAAAAAARQLFFHIPVCAALILRSLAVRAYAQH